MNRNPSKRSSLFLLELMIAILFFCLCSAVCVRLFVQSHIISTDTQNLNMAMNETTNVAEIFRNCDDYYEVLQETYPQGALSDDENLFFIYYDADWSLCSEDNAVYVLTFYAAEQDSSDKDSKAQTDTSTGDTATVANADTNGTLTLIDADIQMASLADTSELYDLKTTKYIGGER